MGVTMIGHRSIDRQARQTNGQTRDIVEIFIWKNMQFFRAHRIQGFSSEKAKSMHLISFYSVNPFVHPKCTTVLLIRSIWCGMFIRVTSYFPFFKLMANGVNKLSCVNQMNSIIMIPLVSPDG